MTDPNARQQAMAGAYAAAVIGGTGSGNSSLPGVPGGTDLYESFALVVPLVAFRNPASAWQVANAIVDENLRLNALQEVLRGYATTESIAAAERHLAVAEPAGSSSRADARAACSLSGMKIPGAGVVPASAPLLSNPAPSLQVIMNSLDFLTLGLALIPYLLTHALIIALLLRLRRGLPEAHRPVSRWLLLAMVLPVVGPFISAVALARLARSYQAATAHLAEFRSDCGHAAGIGYGLTYAAATCRLLRAWPAVACAPGSVLLAGPGRPPGAGPADPPPLGPGARGLRTWRLAGLSRLDTRFMNFPRVNDRVLLGFWRFDSLPRL